MAFLAQNNNSSATQNNILYFPNKKENPSLLLRKRAYGLIVDLVTIGILKKITLHTYAFFLRSFFYQMPLSLKQEVIDSFTAVESLATTTLFLGYFIMSMTWGHGQTIGGLIFGFKSKGEKEKTVTFASAVLNALGNFLSYLSFGLLFFLPLIRKDKRSLGEIWSGTHTVFEKRHNTSDKILTSKSVDDDLEKMAA
ncbi:MAG: RDD family protein [Bacteriovoracaceae bacterium]|nr:RDD family protein [Bacteriovoracaceae bacterium]